MSTRKHDKRRDKLVDAAADLMVGCWNAEGELCNPADGIYMRGMADLIVAATKKGSYTNTYVVYSHITAAGKGKSMEIKEASKND